MFTFDDRQSRSPGESRTGYFYEDAAQPFQVMNGDYGGGDNFGIYDLPANDTLCSTSRLDVDGAK